MDDLVFVSLENWDEIWRRNLFVVAELARRFPDRKIVFVGLPLDVTHGLRHGKIGSFLKALRRPSLPTPPGLPNVYLCNPAKWLPNSLALGRRINQWMERRQLRAVCRSLNLRSPVLWINPQYSVHMAGKLNESCVIYDITDDWISLNQQERMRRLVIADDDRLLRVADAVIVCSERLFELKRSRAKRLYLIPNGVEVERYRFVCAQSPGDPGFAEAEEKLPVPEKPQGWPKPVFGYTGTLHPDRVDTDLILALASAYPSGTIALIGPNLLRPEDRARLEQFPNVRIVGAVPYAELQSWMRAFDVCIVPHQVTPFTESLNPLKLFEYLAAGLPVVSTDVAGFRDFADREAPGAEGRFVYLARGERGGERESAFLGACGLALRERADHNSYTLLSAARRKEAEGHSWKARVDAILDAIDRDVLGNKGAGPEAQTSQQR